MTTCPSSMGHVIGTQGYFFNIITKHSGASYIWYDEDSNTIEVWGKTSRIVKDAEKKVIKRIRMVNMYF